MPNISLNNIPSTPLPTNGAETVIATTAPFVYDFPNEVVGTNQSGAGGGVAISGIVVFTVVGSGVTSASVRIRQGVIGGTVIGPVHQVPIAAGVPNVIPFAVNDNSRWAATPGNVYVVTVTETGATGASTVTGVVNLEGG